MCRAEPIQLSPQPIDVVFTSCSFRENLMENYSKSSGIFWFEQKSRNPGRKISEQNRNSLSPLAIGFELKSSPKRALRSTVFNYARSAVINYDRANFPSGRTGTAPPPCLEQALTNFGHPKSPISRRFDEVYRERNRSRRLAIQPCFA